MSASLVEMVLAIVIAGLIFASAIIPTTQTAVAYQEAEAKVREAACQVTATVRAEQVVGNIWRNDDPPANHDVLLTAQADQLEVGHWELRADSGQFEQNWNAGGWAPIAAPVQGLAFQYILNSGVWVSSVSGPALEDVLAVRFNWSDAGNGRKYGGVVVAPDHTFSGGVIELPQPDTSEPYSRHDYERELTLSLGSWDGSG
jgi:hypothetical protein